MFFMLNKNGLITRKGVSNVMKNRRSKREGRYKRGESYNIFRINFFFVGNKMFVVVFYYVIAISFFFSFLNSGEWR